MKKFVSLMLCFVMVVAMLPQTVLFASAATSGTCGENLTWSLSSGTLTISGTGAMTNWEAAADVPWHSKKSSIKAVVIENGVTSIGNDAFSWCDSLTSVEIPDSVTRVGTYAFYKCGDLTSVTIPDSVTTIGGSAFEDCDKLTAVKLGSGITRISSRLFYDCGKLATLVIPNGVTSIKYAAFANCEKLSAIEIPTGVTSIEEYAFKDCDSLTTVELPDSLTSIGNDAFSYCDGLTTVEFGKGITDIGSYAFYKCTALTALELPDSLTYTGGGTFEDCDSLTSVKLSSGLTNISGRAFYDCDSLTSVVIPNQVTSIGYAAFSSCDRLETVTIPDKTTKIEEYVFNDCDALTDVYYGGTEEEKSGISVMEENSCLLNATWHYSLKGTCGDATLWKLELDGTLTISGTGPMTSWSSASSVPWYANRKSITAVVIESGVTNIGSYAFYDCYSVSSVEIPESVTRIESHAFYGCFALTTLEIPNNVTSIGDYAFYKCASLTSIAIPDSVTSIGAGVFEECDALTTVKFGSGITSIGNGAFYGCGNLTLVEFADDVTSIGDRAFYGCTSLTDVLYGAGMAEKENISIGSGNENFTDAAWSYPGPYAVSILKMEEGTVSSRKHLAVKGETVTLIASANAGYEFVTFLVDGVAISGNTFVMPNREVTVSAEFALVDYTVTVGECENGSVSVNQTIANLGEEITVTATPNTGYELATVFVNGTPISENTFTMPPRDVTVAAEFTKKEYTIEVIQSENGVVMVDKTHATFDEVVTITTAPRIGYEADQIKVNGVVISGNRFLMPKSDVTVTVVFKRMNDVTLSTINGAQIRTTGAQGLRFISSIDKTSVDFDRVVEYGTVLIPSADITDISDLTIGATLNGHTVAKVKANYIYDETDETVTFTAVITDVAEKNYAREYTARAYAILDDGYIVYADTGASRSIYAVAKRGLENPNESEENKEIFQNIVDTVENS